MLKHNEVNPLTVFGLRRMDHCPPHFIPVLFDLRVAEKQISDWVWEHLSGRFYYGDFYTELSNGTLTAQKMFAFEEPGEASYFALMIDTVNNINDLTF
jgi:hypothetical protein